MSISEAVAFFEDNQGITSTLKVMERIGMGYIKLGQPTPTLSGGEAQRIKLAKEIGKRRKGNILYVLDEPRRALAFSIPPNSSSCWTSWQPGEFGHRHRARSGRSKIL